MQNIHQPLNHWSSGPARGQRTLRRLNN